MLETRSTEQCNDFLVFEGGELIGFLGLYALGAQIEITGMVHPAYRHRGIFHSLFKLALEECQTRRFNRLLLVTTQAQNYKPPKK